jgi:glycosyltransferase involved in cell wall biosynthesis
MQSTRRRTVVFLESAADMGGVQFSTLYLAQALDSLRWRSVVVCPADGDLTSACRDAGVEARVIEWPRLWSTSLRAGSNIRLPNPFAWLRNAIVMFYAARLLRVFLEQSAPDVLMTKGLPSHFIGGLAARRVGVPCVWHVQDLISERTFGIYRRIFAFTARHLTQQIVVDGGAIKDQLPQSMHSRVSVIHNGIDTSLFSPDREGSAVRHELRITPDQFVIGHAGRITPWKGQHYLIEAFAKIAAEYPNTVLLLVGSPVFDHDAYEQRLRAMTAAYGLEHRIIFSGYRHDLPNVLAAMDIFAFTSIEKDTSPLALLSAMASGLPIVAFDIEGIRELVDEDTTMALTPSRDTDRMANLLRELIEDRERRAQLGEAARQTSQQNFSLEKFVRRVSDVLMQAVQPAQASASNTEDLAAKRATVLASDAQSSTAS